VVSKLIIKFIITLSLFVALILDDDKRVITTTWRGEPALEREVKKKRGV